MNLITYGTPSCRVRWKSGSFVGVSASTTTVMWGGGEAGEGGDSGEGGLGGGGEGGGGEGGGVPGGWLSTLAVMCECLATMGYCTMHSSYVPAVSVTVTCKLASSCV